LVVKNLYLIHVLLKNSNLCWRDCYNIQHNFIKKIPKINLKIETKIIIL